MNLVFQRKLFNDIIELNKKLKSNYILSCNILEIESLKIIFKFKIIASKERRVLYPLMFVLYTCGIVKMPRYKNIPHLSQKNYHFYENIKIVIFVAYVY